MSTFEPSPDLDPAVARAISQAMDSLRAELGGKRETKPAAPAQDRVEELERATRRIDGAASQTDLLTTTLEEAGRFAERSLFFVRSSDSLNGWAAYGFGADSDAVTALSLTGGPWGVLVDGGGAVDLDAEACGDISAALGARHAKQGLLVPFTLRGQVAGALYADGDELDRPALRLLSRISAQALETLPTRGPSGGEAAVAMPDEPVAESAFVDQEVDEAVEDVMNRIQEVEAEPEEADDADLVAIHHDVTPETPETPETVVEDFTGVELPSSEDDATDLDQVVSAEIEQLDEEPSAVDSTFATQDISTLEETPPVVPPADTEARLIEPAEIAPPSDHEGPGWAFGSAEMTAEDSRHEEARRLARLLVTEIKLYNEEKVREARESQTVYESLREDIDRSQRIYEERIDGEVREGSDYFQEELVRILAGGDPAALGA